MYKRAYGFTIVELLIVIVVVAILASLSYVGYTSIQTRARDAQRRSDIAQIANALRLHKVEYGDMVLRGTSSGGSGNGWIGFDYDYSAGPQVSMMTHLVNLGLLQTELRDPSGMVRCDSSSRCFTYMKYTCSLGTYLYAVIESEPYGHDGPTDGTCAPTWDTQYNINYVIKVE